MFFNWVAVKEIRQVHIFNLRHDAIGTLPGVTHVLVTAMTRPR